MGVWGRMPLPGKAGIRRPTPAHERSNVMADRTAPPDQSLLPAFPVSMGIRLEETGSDLVVGSMEVTAVHGNRNGVMHGGAIMAFADTLGGVAAAVNLSDGDSTTTLDSKTNFVRPIPVGGRITGRCEPLHKGRKISIWQTTVFREDGKPAAIVTQTQMTLVWGAKS